MARNGDILPRSLRCVTSIFTLAAGSVMISAHQTAVCVDRSVYASFGDLAPYWCFVFANFAASAYSALLVCLPTKSLLWRFIVALDAVLVVVLSSSCSAALAIALMERNGNFHARWLPLYHLVPSYCIRVLVAIGVGYVGVIIYVFLHLFSIQAALNSILVD